MSLNIDCRLDGLKAVGFDLDKTLYKGTPDIDQMVTKYIIRRAAEELRIFERDAGDKFKREYAKSNSAHRSLMALGITPKPRAQRIVQDALENADIPSVLNEDPELQDMLVQLYEKYQLFLIPVAEEI